MLGGISPAGGGRHRAIVDGRLSMAGGRCSSDASAPAPVVTSTVYTGGAEDTVAGPQRLHFMLLWMLLGYVYSSRGQIHIRERRPRCCQPIRQVLVAFASCEARSSAQSRQSQTPFADHQATESVDDASFPHELAIGRTSALPCEIKRRLRHRLVLISAPTCYSCWLYCLFIVADGFTVSKYIKAVPVSSILRVYLLSRALQSDTSVSKHWLS